MSISSNFNERTTVSEDAVTVPMPQAMKAQLSSLASAQYVSMAAIVRQFVASGLEQRRQREAVTR